MRISILMTIFMLMFNNGCAMFENMTIEERSNFVNRIAKNGTYLAIMSIYDKEDELKERNKIARILKEDISINVINILSNKSISINEETFNNFLKNVPTKIRPFLVSALDMVEMTKINVDNIEKYKIQIVKAFFDGIISGCNMVLGSNQNNVLEKDRN